MTSANIVDDLIKDIKERLTLDGKNRVFNEGKELRSEFMNEEAEPEAFTREFLINKIFSALEREKLPEKKIEDSRGLRKLYISMATITTMAGYMPLLADISGLAAIFYKKKVEEMNSECLFQ
jgi:hypothetical protein